MNNHPIPIPYSDDMEMVPRDESDNIARVLETMQELLRRNADRRGKPAREVHVKSHGCVDAIFQILGGLPDELAQGLFAQQANYPAVMRFSNSNPFCHWDLFPDGRGLAIQIHEGTGKFLHTDQASPTQDFLMANHPTFLVPDVSHYLQLQKARLNPGLNGIASAAHAFTNAAWNPLQWNWMAVVSLTQVASQFPRHPAAYRYYSMVPFRFGQYVAKYRVQPSDTTNSGWLAGALWRPDAMKDAIEQSLRQGSFNLEFQVQLRISASSMPIENASIRWPETESPFRTVAHIHVPSQDLTCKMPHEDEDFRFDVWHALTAHRPLGGINRVRKVAYPASVNWRLTGNEQTRTG